MTYTEVKPWKGRSGKAVMRKSRLNLRKNNPADTSVSALSLPAGLGNNKGAVSAIFAALGFVTAGLASQCKKSQPFASAMGKTLVCNSSFELESE